MWDLKCIASAVCFFVSNILFIVHGVIMMYSNNKAEQTDSSLEDNTSTTSWNFESWKELDPAYIETRWVQREDSRPIMMSAALFGALAWFWLIAPIVQSAWILSKGGKRGVGLHMALASLGICGGIIELLARLLTVGMTNAAQWLAKDFNLDNWDTQGDGTGWRVLEMIHIVTRGMILWIDAFEALAFFGITFIIFYSSATEPKFRTKRSASILAESEDADAASGGSSLVSDSGVSNGAPPSSPPPSKAFGHTKVPLNPTFSKCFARYGVFVGFLALIDFFADILRFVDWQLFGRISMATNALVGVIFLPLWLLILSSELPLATQNFESTERRIASNILALDDEKSSLLKGVDTGDDREIS